MHMRSPEAERLALSKSCGFGRLDQEGILTAWRQWSAIRQAIFLILSGASRVMLNPLPPPGRRLEGIPEILCFVDERR